MSLLLVSFWLYTNPLRFPTLYNCKRLVLKTYNVWYLVLTHQDYNTIHMEPILLSNFKLKYIHFLSTVKCRYNAVFGVQEIDRAIAVTAL